jgi:tetratricopeptide (TPR) repeat protein
MTGDIKRTVLVFVVGAVMVFLLTSPCLPQNAQQYYQQGLEAYQDGKWELAIQQWKSAASLDPKSAKIHEALGLAYRWLGAGDKNRQRGQGNCRSAIEEFKKAVSLDPQYAKAYSNMGGAYGCLGDNDKAIQSYEKALALNPKLKFSYYYLALLYKERNEIAKAKQLVRQGDLQPEEPQEDTDEGWYIQFLDYLTWKSLGPTLQELRQ